MAISCLILRDGLTTMVDALLRMRKVYVCRGLTLFLPHGVEERGAKPLASQSSVSNHEAGCIGRFFEQGLKEIGCGWQNYWIQNYCNCD